MNTKEVWDVALAVIGALGGGGLIVVGLSSFLGKLWADRALDKQRQDYAQLNIAFTQQLDLATRRVQVELDAIGHLHKLRTESEFQKISELWKSIAMVENAFHALPIPGFVFNTGSEDQQQQTRFDSSMKFSMRLNEASLLWRLETLSIPPNIRQESGALLLIAHDELAQVFLHPDPFTSIGLTTKQARDAFWEHRSKKLSEFDAGIKKLEPMIREYLQGIKTVP